MNILKSKLCVMCSTVFHSTPNAKYCPPCKGLAKRVRSKEAYEKSTGKKVLTPSRTKGALVDVEQMNLNRAVDDRYAVKIGEVTIYQRGTAEFDRIAEDIMRRRA